MMKVQEKAGKLEKEGTLVRAVMKNMKGMTMMTGQLRSGEELRTKPKEKERRRLMRQNTNRNHELCRMFEKSQHISDRLSMNTRQKIK